MAARIDRTQRELIKRLQEHCAILQDFHFRACQQGHHHYFGEIAGKLRLLVYSSRTNRPLLLDLMAEAGFQVPFILDQGPKGQIQTDLPTYLSSLSVVIRIPSTNKPAELSNYDLIALWSQQCGSAHEDWKLDERLASIFAEAFFLNGQPSHGLALCAICRTVLHVAREFLHLIEPKQEEGSKPQEPTDGSPNSGRVHFRFISFISSNALDKSNLLSSKGTFIFQRIGFPHDFDDCTCIPIGPAGVLSVASGSVPLEEQWYQPAQPIARIDIPANLFNCPMLKGYVCHLRRPNPNVYDIASVALDEKEIQWIGFVGKRIIYRRLGQIVEIDLSDVANEQTFTLSAEWDMDYIELRVTWLKEPGTDAHSSGQGISELQNLDTYRPPSTASVVRFTQRLKFEATSATHANISDNKTRRKPKLDVGEWCAFWPFHPWKT